MVESGGTKADWHESGNRLTQIMGEKLRWRPKKGHAVKVKSLLEKEIMGPPALLVR